MNSQTKGILCRHSFSYLSHSKYAFPIHLYTSLGYCDLHKEYEANPPFHGSLSSIDVNPYSIKVIKDGITSYILTDQFLSL